MNALDPEARLKLVNAGGKFLVAAEEFVEKLFSAWREVALARHVKDVQEFAVISTFHTSKRMPPAVRL